MSAEKARASREPWDASGGDAHGSLVGATLSVTDLASTVRLYRDHLGYRLLDRGLVETTLAESWGAPRQAGRPYALLEPESGADVTLRVVEGSAPPEPSAPLRTYGWAALEITVQNADDLHARLAESPFELLGPPTELEFTDRIYPMQVVGPEGVVLYLNEVRGDLPDFDLPLARSFVDRLFIVVLAAADLDASLSFYRRALLFDEGNRYEIPYGLINRAFGFPADRRHRLAMACVGRRVNIEVDEYPEETVERPRVEGELPPAIAMVSLGIRSLEELKVDLLNPPDRRQEPPYRGRRAAACIGAAGELIELVETSEGHGGSA